MAGPSALPTTYGSLVLLLIPQPEPRGAPRVPPNFDDCREPGCTDAPYSCTCCAGTASSRQYTGIAAALARIQVTAHAAMGRWVDPRPARRGAGVPAAVVRQQQHAPVMDLNQSRASTAARRPRRGSWLAAYRSTLDAIRTRHRLEARRPFSSTAAASPHPLRILDSLCLVAARPALPPKVLLLLPRLLVIACCVVAFVLVAAVVFVAVALLSLSLLFSPGRKSIFGADVIVGRPSV